MYDNDIIISINSAKSSFPELLQLPYPVFCAIFSANTKYLVCFLLYAEAKFPHPQYLSLCGSGLRCVRVGASIARPPMPVAIYSPFAGQNSPQFSFRFTF